MPDHAVLYNLFVDLESAHQKLRRTAACRSQRELYARFICVLCLFALLWVECFLPLVHFFFFRALRGRFQCHIQKRELRSLLLFEHFRFILHAGWTADVHLTEGYEFMLLFALLRSFLLACGYRWLHVGRRHCLQQRQDIMGRLNRRVVQVLDFVFEFNLFFCFGYLWFFRLRFGLSLALALRLLFSSSGFALGRALA